MWGAFDHLLPRLEALHPGAAGGDADLLSAAFGRTQFVLLCREDEVGQAVSWARAEQTQRWHPTDGPGNAVEPTYDVDELDSYVQTIRELDAAWRAWFAEHGIVPHQLRYEDLVADAAGEVQRLLRAVGVVDQWDGALHHEARRQADAINLEWVGRYRRDRRRR
jgi:LPS sulfotransferase NodH